MAKQKQLPTGVKILSILYQIGGIIDLLLGVLLLTIGTSLASLVAGSNPLASLFGAIGGAVVIGMGIILLLVGTLAFLIGRGLWNAKNWARIIAAVFAVLGIVGSLSGIAAGAVIPNIVGLAVNGLIGWYLLMNEDVKKVFK